MLATILKWLPASGKSTLAKTLDRLHISKDIIRKSHQWIKESEVSDIQLKQIQESAKSNIDIVIDNTHMNPRTLQSTIDICKNLWYEIKVIDMFEYNWYTDTLTYLSECFERNNKREDKVPWSVLDYMFLMNYGINQDYYIFDIDWTLAKMNPKRREALDNKDYDTFYWPLVLEDEPIHNVINILKYLNTNGKCIILVSWRSNQCYDYTVQRLEKHWIYYYYLLMRNEWDYRTDYKVKSQMYHSCLSDGNCLWVFDDRNSVLGMWRSLWLFTFDVSQGLGDF